MKGRSVKMGKAKVAPALAVGPELNSGETAEGAGETDEGAGETDKEAEEDDEGPSDDEAPAEEAAKV